MISSLSPRPIPEDAEAIRSHVKAFLQANLPDSSASVKARSWMGFDADFSRALAQAGMVGLTIPKEYGGAGRDFFTRFVVAEELLSSGAPVSAHWIADRQSAPLILKLGTESQKQFYLPKICRGEAFFCIGMSEPNSGSDLASVRSRATKNDEGWIISGQKIWTTNAPKSHYMIALMRTSGKSDDRNKGLSQFIIDLSLPGITIKPIADLTGDSHFSEIIFDNVQLCDDSLIGLEGKGWEQVVSELAYERSGPERILSSIVLLDYWAESLKRKDVISSKDEEILGRLVCHLSVLRTMSISVNEMLVRGLSPIVEAALVKDMGTEFEQLIPALISSQIGSDPFSPVDFELLKTLMYVTQVCPSFSLRGGTREILRGMIARGLGLR